MNRLFKIQIIQPNFNELYKKYEQTFIDSQKQRSGTVAIKIQGELEGANIEDNITEGGSLLEAEKIKNSSIRGNRTILPSLKDNPLIIKKLEIIGRDKIEQHDGKNKASIENKNGKEGLLDKFFWPIIVGLILLIIGEIIRYYW